MTTTSLVILFFLQIQAKLLETLSKGTITNRSGKGFKLSLTLGSPSTRFAFCCCYFSLVFCCFFYCCCCCFNCEVKLVFYFYFASHDFIPGA